MMSILKFDLMNYTGYFEEQLNVFSNENITEVYYAKLISNLIGIPYTTTEVPLYLILSLFLINVMKN